MHIARRYSPPPPDPYPLPSLRLVILCVSVAVALSMVVVILLIDVRPPPLSDIFLTTSYFPLGQSLMLKTRRWTRNEKNCLSYGVPRFNPNYTDTLCGLAVWQSSADSEEGDRYVNKIETVYRFFLSENASAEYFEWYINKGAQLQLPVEHYSDETEIAPKAGNEYRAFKWDPILSNLVSNGTSTISNSSKPKHKPKPCNTKECADVFRNIVYVFRQKNAFARLIISGFNESRDARLGVDFAGRLAGTMVDLISQNQPSSLDSFIINFQTWVHFMIRTLPLRMMNKAYVGIIMLGHGVMAMFDVESWLTLLNLVVGQLHLLWHHLIDASIKDLYFLAVALLLLMIHKTQIFLTPYDEMNTVHMKCRSLLTLAVEKTRRQADSVKEDILIQT